MRKFGIHRILCLFLALLLMTMPAYGATKKEVEEEKSKAQVIAAEKQKTEQKIAELEALKGDTQAYIRELDMQLLQLADELDQLETDIADKQAEVDETTAHLAEAEQTEREQYEAMKPGLGWMHVKDYAKTSVAVKGGRQDEDKMKGFVPCDQGYSGHEAILRDFAKILPELTAYSQNRGIPGVFLDLEPHVRGGGQFGGYSGADGLGVALRALCNTLDYVGIGYHLRDFDDLRAARGF